MQDVEPVVERMARKLCRMDLRNRFLTEHEKDILVAANWRALISRAEGLVEMLRAAGQLEE